MEALRVFAILALLGLARCQSTVTYSYSSFSPSDLNNFQLNGHAASFNPSGDGRIVLTDANQNRGGSAFFKNSVPLTGPSGFKGSFSTVFSFQMTTNGGGGDEDGVGADGIMFIINSQTNQVGTVGSGMGYVGLGNSVGIEFDTYHNGDQGDPNGNHVAINVNGGLNGNSVSVNPRMNDGNVWWAWIDYNGDVGIIEVRVATSNNRPATPTVTRAVNLAATLGNPNAYVGFSAATGLYYEYHRINSWTFTNTYAPIVTLPPAVCGNGIIETGESCDGGACCSGSCTYLSSATVCRSSAGACDVAEYCTGNNFVCPADGFAPSSTTCRSSAGPCDVAEKCPGNSAGCPADSFVSSSTVCRNSAGPCDVAESCTGSSAACPADAFSSASTTCRNSAGICDVAETCSGSSAGCPADSFVSSSVECRPSAGVCDVAETCSGSSATCPADGFASSSTTCRGAADVCDVAETCTGSGASCPADSFASSSTVCRNSAGPCDVAESCTGSGASCPSDAFVAASFECRPSAGICDIAETCSGSTAGCPADAFESSSVVCRNSAGICDPEETCDGSSAPCPADTLHDSSTTCRPSVSTCDPSEVCTGSDVTCPDDATGSFESACTGLAFTVGSDEFSFTDFDVISFGNFIGSNTGAVEGRLAARGQVSLGTGYSVGYSLDTSANGDDNSLPYSLIGGGDVSWTSGAIFPSGTNGRGDAEGMFVGGSFTGSEDLALRVTGGPCPTPGCLDDEFDDAHTCYNIFQASLAGHADNVQKVIEWSGLYLTCDTNDADVNYVSLLPSEMSQYTWVSLTNCNPDARWVINVGGSGNVTLNGAYWGLDSSAVLWNIQGSGRFINVFNVQVPGTILSPNNILNQPSGQIDGRVVVGDVVTALNILSPGCHPIPI
eukprot:TRINITY_DN50_c0_g1_i1.p1 TRINITY_DN50_c0_g1~~TRINITY_DN50_c0_g1_i1.p1  ORF type:complete len:895 (+),score=192.43 TRINITY_DN50_c0_g1_i1:91-2775(+)